MIGKIQKSIQGSVFGSAVALSSLLGATSEVAQAQTFAPVVPYASGSTTSSTEDVAVGDVNGDGKLDLVAANGNNHTVGVLLGRGDGTFQGPTLYSTGTSSVYANYYAGAVVLGDVNKDGKLDILTANGFAQTVAVLLGNGDGTFRTVTTYTTGAGYADDLAVTDLNGDGRLDVVVANGFGNSVVVLLGRGDGTFLAATSYTVGSGNTPVDIAVADVNKDAQADVLVVNSNGYSVSVLLGNGNGTLQAAKTYSAGSSSSPAGLAVGDLNGDGKPDVATANESNDGAGVLLGNGDGTFQAATVYPAIAMSSPNAVALADVTGDGKVDITATSFNNSTVMVLPGRGDGTFQTAVPFSTGPSSSPDGVAAVDVNKDGLPDLLTVNTNGKAIGVLLNTYAPPAPDLVVSTTTSIAAGTYNSITVTGTGVGTLAGNVVVNSKVTVQTGGTLNDGCSVISGAGDFTLAAGGKLGICNAQGISTLAGQGMLQNTGLRVLSTDASYVYNGTVAQVTGNALPAQVRNLTTTNASRVTLSQGVAIAQVLTIGGQGGLTQPSAAASITLLSDATTGTALIANTGGYLQGNTTTVQLAFAGSTNPGLGYRHVAPPVFGATIGSLTTVGFTPVVNSLYNTRGASVRPFPTTYFYDESRLNDPSVPGSGFDKGWVSPNDLTDQLFNAVGYTVQLPATAKLSVTGGVFSGGIGFDITRTGADADAGWSLVGNPYPSPLDWSLVNASQRTNLDAAMYVFESTGPYTGQYRSYANGIGGSPIIPLGQAFFVRVSTGQTRGTITFRDAQRLTTFDATPVKRTAADPRPQVALSLRNATAADVTYLYQEAGATAGVDAAYDALKMPNTNGLNISQLAANTKLAINGLPLLTPATTVPLAVGVPAAGTYTLAATTLSNLPAGLEAYLRDVQTGQTTRLSAGASYAFSVSAAEAQAIIVGRFSLQLSAPTPLATNAALVATEVTVYPNPARESFTVAVPGVAGASQVQAQLCNALGQVVRQQAAALPATGVRLRVATGTLAPGVYVLRLQAGASAIAQRIVIQ